MKRKLLLFLGLITILYGISGLAVTYYIYQSSAPLMEKLPINLKNSLITVTKTSKDAVKAVYDASESLKVAADNVDVEILFWRPFTATANSLRSTAQSVEEVGKDLEYFASQVDEISTECIKELDHVWLAFNALFLWISILHIIFIIIGIGFLLTSRL